VELPAPRRLSVFDEPEATVGFCNDLQLHLSERQRRVFVDLDSVEYVSSDALLLMRAIIQDAKKRSVQVSGNLPKDAAVAAKVKLSGFFEGIAHPPRELPVAQGMMRRKSSTTVDSEVAAELVEFAMKNAKIPKAIADASFKNLVELMLNTHNHAAERQGESHATAERSRWWAHVYCEEDTAYFSFLDLGVGILRSAAPRTFLRERGFSLFGYGPRRLLQDVFQGMIGASSKYPGRGYGLTRMRAAAQSNNLVQLRVMTLSTLGEVADMNFREAKTSLRGTLFRWRTGNPSTES
jgi:hypothetical protein